MENVTSYIVTAALPYANGPIHIGHLSGVYIPADIYVRYLRINKKKVIFICGSDEHGAPITIRSKKENVSPKKIIDKYHNLNKEYLKKIGINFNIFFRTSSLLHKYTVQKFFIELKKKKKFKIYKNDQFYDVKYKHFLSDRYLIGDCPKCNNKSYGDQCESCGYVLNFNELKNPKSILSKSKPILRSTKH
jgi:methionyl-tRNA synthetase